MDRGDGQDVVASVLRASANRRPTRPLPSAKGWAVSNWACTSAVLSDGSAQLVLVLVVDHTGVYLEVVGEILDVFISWWPSGQESADSLGRRE